MRIKPKNIYPLIKDTGDADSALKKIGQLQRRLQEIQNEAEERIEKTKQSYASKSAPIFDEIKKISVGLSAFGTTYKDKLFPDKKTLELNFGFLGFRQSTKITITHQTIKLLKQFKYLDAIITKESPNKEVLVTYSPEKLIEVKAKKEVTDEFWFETKIETETPKNGQ